MNSCNHCHDETTRTIPDADGSPLIVEADGTPHTCWCVRHGGECIGADHGPKPR